MTLLITKLFVEQSRLHQVCKLDIEREKIGGRILATFRLNKFQVFRAFFVLLGSCLSLYVLKGDSSDKIDFFVPIPVWPSLWYTIFTQVLMLIVSVDNSIVIF